MYEKTQSELLDKISIITNSWLDINDEYIPGDFLNVFNKDYISYSNVADTSRKLTSILIKKIIIETLKKYNYVFLDVTSDITNNNEEVDKENRFCLIVSDKSTNNQKLYIFKEFGINHHIKLDLLSSILSKHNISKYSYISYVQEGSWKEILNFNKDSNSDDKGTNVFSIKNFITSFFSEEEYNIFFQTINEFKLKIRKQIDYSVVRMLDNNTIYDFKNTIIEEIENFEYNLTVYNKENEAINLTDLESQRIRRQFIDLKYYEILLGDSKFSECFITSEWLFKALQNSVNVDFTTIALGYLKSVEQLLFTFVSSHTSEKDGVSREIQNGRPYLNKRTGKYKPNYDDFTNDFLENNKEKITIGPLLDFIGYYKNKDLISNHTDNLYKYIRSLAYKFKEDRNKYLHRVNMPNIEVVESIRKDTFMFFYILLGSYNISDSETYSIFSRRVVKETDKLFKYLNYNVQKDYQLLNNQISNNCEYIELPLFFLVKNNVTYGPYRADKNISLDHRNRIIFKRTNIRDPKCVCESDILINSDEFDYLVIQSSLMINRHNPSDIKASSEKKVIFDGEKFLLNVLN